MKKSKEINASRNILPPGKYWIGDFFYAQDVLHIDTYEKTQTGEGLKLWYIESEITHGCYQILKNTLQNAKVPEGGFFESSHLFGIVPFQLPEGSDQDCSHGVTVSFSDEVKYFCEDGLFRFTSGKGELIITYIEDTLPVVVGALAELKDLDILEMLTKNEVGSVSRAINNINSYYQLALNAIRDDYENGYQVKNFVKGHLKFLGQCFEKSAPKTFSIDIFLSIIRLACISLHPDYDDKNIHFRYRVYNLITDESISVTFDPLGQVESVSVES
jgi:hypothetical protein